MALNARQNKLYDDLIRQWEFDQEGSGNPTPRVTLAFATTPQVKAATLTYVTAKKAALQAVVAGLAASRAAQDAALTQQIADMDAIITELG